MPYPTPDRHYVWIRREDGPLGEQRYQQISRVDDRTTADALRDALERTGFRVYVRHNDARYPGTP